MVTWTLLAPDAPEPGPLSVVRDKDGDWWVHGPGPDAEHWYCIGGALESVTGAGVKAEWEAVLDSAPLELGSADGYLWPLVERTEPGPYEVRRDALTAACRLEYEGVGEADDPRDVLRAAREFEPYLRGEGTCPAVYAPASESLPCGRPVGHEGWHAGFNPATGQTATWSA